MKDIAVVMGSVSDAAVMTKAVDVLSTFGVEFDYLVVSAHRTPERLYEFSRSAHERFKVIIAGAGGAAHLPGMIAAMTSLPVIGVPVATGSLRGVDALLSIAQMPDGVPVGAVRVDGSVNAAFMALRILAIQDARVRDALSRHRREAEAAVPERP